MSDIKLSICIPTYNREDFLRNALSYCLRDFDFDFPYEIVINDNASTDRTGEVAAEFKEKGLPIRYYRRKDNGGSLPNLASAIHHAFGEYIVYLADDDILLPKQVSDIVRFMDENMDVGVCQAPWTFYDEVDDVDTSKFYNVEKDVTFRKGDFRGVFEYIYERHIFPEMAVYRASIIRSAWVPREFCFYPFAYLAHFLSQSDVAFHKEPFYRSVTRSKVKNARTQAGNEQVMTSWDNYKGGLDYFIYSGIKLGSMPKSINDLKAYEEKCRIFTLNRMAVALRFWAGKKDFVKVYELYTRLALGGFGDHPDVAPRVKSLQLFVGCQTLAWKVNATADVDRLLLRGVANPEALENLLRELGLADEVAVVVDNGEQPSELADKTAVLFADEADRDGFLALGYRPGLLFTDAELMRHTLI